MKKIERSKKGITKNNLKINKIKSSHTGKKPKILIKITILFILSIILQIYYLDPLIVFLFNILLITFSRLFFRNPEINYLLTSILLIFLIKRDPFSVFLYLLVIFFTLTLELKRNYDSFLNLILLQTSLISFLISFIFFQLILQTFNSLYLYQYIIFLIIIPSIILIITFSLINYWILEPKKTEKINEKKELLLFFIKLGIRTIIIITLMCFILYFLILNYYNNMIDKNTNYVIQGIEKLKEQLSEFSNISTIKEEFLEKGILEKDIIEKIVYYKELTKIATELSVNYSKYKDKCINVTVSNSTEHQNSRIYRIIKESINKIYLFNTLKSIKEIVNEIITNSSIRCNETKN